VTFESTLPLGEPELMRVSAFQRYLAELKREGADESLTRLSSLNPSLLQDLLRFEQDGRHSELLEVLAACVRHARPLAVYLQCGLRVVPLTVFPTERLAHCPLPMHEFLAQRLSDLEVLRVEPAVLRPPGDPEAALVGEPHLYQPLGPVAWELAMRGSREQLLPEIAGPSGLPRRARHQPARSGADRRGAGCREPPAPRERQPARDVGMARPEPWPRDAPAQRAVSAGWADRQPHPPGGHQRQLVRQLTQLSSEPSPAQVFPAF
jgi:hypothetical protein